MNSRFEFGSAGQPLGWPAFVIAAVLAGAILFGGGGAEGPLNNGLVLATSAALMFGLFAGHWSGARPLPPSAVVPMILVAGFLLIGVIQLVPVPPEMWRAQPGRELALSVLQLVHAGDAWRALSLDPAATRRAMTAMLLPAAMMFAVIGSTRREIALLLQTIIVCAVISSVVGALQLALRYPSWLTYYDGGNSGAAAGVFANVNHQAALLLVTIVCVGIAICLSRSAADRHFDRGGRTSASRWLLIPFFLVVIFATGSRAGLLLLAFAVPLSVMIGTGRTSARLSIAALLGVGLIAFVLAEVSPRGTSCRSARAFCSPMTSATRSCRMCCSR